MVNVQYIWLSKFDNEEQQQKSQKSLLFQNQPKSAPSSSSSSLISSIPSIRILYIHIGKTGGEFLKSQLKGLCYTRKEKRLRQECYDKFVIETKKTEPALPLLSQYTIGYNHASTTILHLNSPSSLSNNNNLNNYYYTHVLFSIRHPLSRLISWYKYNHPKSCDYRERQSPSCLSSSKKRIWSKQFFVECFPTIDSLTKIIQIQSMDHNTTIGNTKYISECSKIFWNGWYGIDIPSIKEPNHLYWNYHFYWNQTRSEILKQQQQQQREQTTIGGNNNDTPNHQKLLLPKILVIRQESLKEDALRLEDYLSSFVGRKLGTEASEVVNSKPTASSNIQFFPPESQHYVKPWNRQQQRFRPPINNIMNIQQQQQQQRFPAINKYGGVGVGVGVGVSVDNSNDAYGGLSKQQRRYLCDCILFEEIMIYQHLILQSDNLNNNNNNQKDEIETILTTRLWKEGCGYDDNDDDIPTTKNMKKDDDNPWANILSSSTTTTETIRRRQKSALCNHGIDV